VMNYTISILPSCVIYDFGVFDFASNTSNPHASNLEVS